VNGSELNGRNIKALLSKPTKPVYEKNVVFITELPSVVTDTEVQEAFSPHGKVRQIRLQRTETGACRGYGYVEFEDDIAAKLALSLDQKLCIGDKSIRVAASIPMKSHKWAVAPVNKVLKERKKIEASQPRPDTFTVHVSNLSFKTTEESLAAHFNQCGAVEQALVCRKDGKSRGFGFVKFHNDTDAFGALVLNNTKLDGRTISVSQSTRSITQPKPTESTVISESKHKGKGARLNLEKLSNTVEGEAEESVPIEPQKKTNREFRKMLLEGELP